MITPPLTIAQFKAQYGREFVYGLSPDTAMDSDIQSAINQAVLIHNPDLWDTTTEEPIAFGLIVAHFLAFKLQVAGGVSLKNVGSGAQSYGRGMIQSKTVSGVSLTYAVSEIVKEDPTLSTFALTEFGVEYLGIAWPRTVAPGFSVPGPDQRIRLRSTSVFTEALATGNFDFDVASDIAAFGSVVPHYFFIGSNIAEAGARIILGKLGTIANLVINVASNTLNHAVTFTVMQNGVATACVATLIVGAVQTSNTINSLTVQPNDEISIKVDFTAATAGLLGAVRGTAAYVDPSN